MQLGQQIALTEPVGSRADRRSDRIFANSNDGVLADGIFAPSEKQYVGDSGLRLQIPKKQIDQIVKEELKKSQSNGRCKLRWRECRYWRFPPEVDTRQVPPGSSRAIRRSLQRRRRYVNGHNYGDKKCIRFSHDTIDPSRHRQILNVEVNIVGLPEGYADTARININSNGGTSTIPVTFSVTLPYEFARSLLGWLPPRLGCWLAECWAVRPTCCSRPCAGVPGHWIFWQLLRFSRERLVHLRTATASGGVGHSYLPYGLV